MFQANEMVVEACVFNLSQIGEHCHSITDEYKALHPALPWHEMYGLRNRIVHNYEGVNLKLVWEIISEDLTEYYKSSFYHSYKHTKRDTTIVASLFCWFRYYLLYP